MTDIQLAHFSFGGASADQSRFHGVAMHEARVATDHVEAINPASSRTSAASRLGLTTRLRLVFAGGAAATTEACSCPA